MLVPLRTMYAQTLSAETTVAQALQASPAIGSAFVARRTACVGCYLVRFCTLGDAAGYYHLPLEAFIDELRLVHSDFTDTQGESHA